MIHCWERDLCCREEGLLVIIYHQGTKLLVDEGVGETAVSQVLELIIPFYSQVRKIQFVS